ncbi:MAG: hypothetical protein GXZ13_02220 [Synergistaceae bacterium]|nr:hypothetical protein [Synergistaceae bacterium]
MVKEQNLALNPAKISGICGRLMCCMSFEHDVYHEIWKKLPNPGSKIKTPTGNVVITGIELHKENVRSFVPGKGEIKVPISKFEEFKSTLLSGEEWIVDEYSENLTNLSEKPVVDFNLLIGENSDNNSNKPLNFKERAASSANKRKKHRLKNIIKPVANKISDNVSPNSTSDETATEAPTKMNPKYTKFKKNRSKRKINKKNRKNINKQENKI